MSTDASSPRSRLVFIDNLRAVVIVLVMMVHLSITYGGEGGWYYKEVQADTITGMVLTTHNIINQSFFMGCLFLLSGYFTPASFDRKGPRRFLLDRLVRLGIPLLLYDRVMYPFIVYWLGRHGVVNHTGSFRDWVGWYYTSFQIGQGPLWFVEALLLFSLVYAAWRLAGRSPTQATDSDGKLPSALSLALLAVFLGIITFLVRLQWPIGWSFGPLNFQFPFFPQYIVMFILGVAASRRQWLTRMPKTMGRSALLLAAGFVFVLLPVLMLLGGAAKGDVSRYVGGLHWQALALVLWEQGLGVLLTVGLIGLFRERLNRQGRLARAASDNSYAAYVIHALVLVVFALLVRDIHLYPLLKFALVTLVVVPLCFALAALIRQVPGVRRVL